MATAIIENSQVHRLHSEVVGDDFEISLLPPLVMPEEPLPVIYFTDANNGFGMAADIVGGLTLGGEIPPCLLVGVGYPIGRDFQQFIRLRTRDFSPSKDPYQAGQMALVAGSEVPCGGAPRFLEFLTTELRDWVGSRFRVSDDATYVGDSMGGLFGTYTLLNKPASFNRYVIGSPWLCWDHPLSFDFERRYAEAHDDLAATVYLAAGDEEHMLYPGLPEPLVPIFKTANTADYTQQMSDRLTGRNYPSLNLTTRVLAEETHFTIISGLVAKGLRTVFN